MIGTVIISVIANNAILVVGFAAKNGFEYLKKRIGNKRYKELVEAGKGIVENLTKLSKALGVNDDIAKIESVAIDDLCKATGIDEARAKQVIVDVIKEITGAAEKEAGQ